MTAETVPPPFGRFDGEIPARALLAASTGGHLTELTRFAAGWNLAPDSLWVTFDTPQSQSLLKGRRTRFVPYIAPRGLRELIRVLPSIQKIVQDEEFDIAVSTGAALALAVLPIAAVHAIPTYYIESVSRVQGPSVSGRILSALPRIVTFTQHPGWSGNRWPVHPSVLEQFRPVPSGRPTPTKPRLFVTLGTIRPYRFDSVVDAVLASGLANETTVWQLGETRRTDLPGTVYDHMSAADFRRAATAADIVVTHAGVGTIIGMLEWGIHPVVVPRSKRRGEHVDDHQSQIAELVSRTGVATVTEAPDLNDGVLRSAGAYVTVSGAY